MIKNADITLYNKIPGEKAVYQRSYLYGVMWQDVHGVNIEDKGLAVADHTDIYIPFSVITKQNYALPKVFNTISDRGKMFTFKPGDIVVKGIIDLDLVGEPGKDEKVLKKTHDNVRIIKSVDTYDFGSGDMQHWEVVAV